ncbi:DUF952 domain-containing protein [Hymenobacter caeli]|uniref:Uncharacterized protein (DUF952 family) n=1 Tax=Hymenobacter caeli TaxID=2735894 RepID=A0ABX2FW34_9BACT|nr:DUF952 domain-containing protein [Hymenobacter caeli]NRT21420.1 uncharacterized protein (DUF952 family) [Hymenobacter caeli]
MEGLAPALYRLADLPDWEAAQQTGFFASADLAAEGFIHTSELSQVLETARRHYAGRGALVLLEIDEAALAAAGVRVEREWAPKRGEFFAHAFAPIPVAAVRRTWPFREDAAGGFALPVDLEE